MQGSLLAAIVKDTSDQADQIVDRLREVKGNIARNTPGQLAGEEAAVGSATPPAQGLAGKVRQAGLVKTPDEEQGVDRVLACGWGGLQRARPDMGV